MRIWKIILIGILVVLLGLFFVRAVLPSQIDDVNPLMGCTDEVLDLADVYYVVPLFDEVEIDRGWCEYILGKDKELAMHGVYHTYEEFGVYRDEAYFDRGARVFEECFGVAPDRFKPGQLAWTEKNDWIKDRMEVDLFWGQLFHKVYHCNDTGTFPNWFIRIY